jgi:hypothetical protein
MGAVERRVVLFHGKAGKIHGVKAGFCDDSNRLNVADARAERLCLSG